MNTYPSVWLGQRAKNVIQEDLEKMILTKLHILNEFWTFYWMKSLKATFFWNIAICIFLVKIPKITFYIVILTPLSLSGSSLKTIRSYFQLHSAGGTLWFWMANFPLISKVAKEESDKYLRLCCIFDMEIYIQQGFLWCRHKCPCKREIFNPEREKKIIYRLPC